MDRVYHRLADEGLRVVAEIHEQGTQAQHVDRKQLMAPWAKLHLEWTSYRCIAA